MTEPGLGEPTVADSFPIDEQTPATDRVASETEDLLPCQIGAFFDVDETLVRGATAFWAAKEMFGRGLFGVRDLLFAARQSIRFVLFGEDRSKIDGIVDRAIRVLEGSSIQEHFDIGEQLFEDYFLPRVYQPTYERLKAHIEAGHQVWLVSATPWVIAEVFARRLGLAGGVGTRLQVVAGRVQGGIEGRIMHGPAKAEVLQRIATQHNLSLKDSWAYSDSASDIPLLSEVGHPVAVNPDRELTHFALANDWEVLNARTTADLLKRNAAKTAMAAATVGAAWLVGNRLLRSSGKFKSK